MHKGESLPGIPVLLLDDDHRTSCVVQGEAKNRILLGDLPLSVIAITAEHQHATGLQRFPVGIEIILLIQPEPLPRDTRRLLQIIAG